MFGHVPEHRQAFVAHYALPSQLGRSLASLCREGTTIGPALKGLRQWLRLHVLAPDELALPSRAVELVWREFEQMSADYGDFHRHAYGERLHHGDKLPAAAQPTADAEALTFALACVDEGQRPRYPHELPLLFTVDTSLGIVDGRRFLLGCGHEPCTVTDGGRCVHHDLVPLVPDHLPKQVRFDASARHPLQDKSDLLFTPGTYGSTTGM